MAEKKLMKGNEAFAAAAINAGCRYYFGYPITPQSEVLETLAEAVRIDAAHRDEIPSTKGLLV